MKNIPYAIQICDRTDIVKWDVDKERERACTFNRTTQSIQLYRMF